MRMITGFHPAPGGTVTVGGHDIWTSPSPPKNSSATCRKTRPAYTDMTVHGFLNFAAEIRGLRGEAKKKAVSRVVEMCFLEAVLHQNVDTLSKGYRHRTCFAQSIIHDPDVLVLDEPTDGLDPNQKHEVRQLIRRMGENKAIIFSTHILEEVDAACTRAIIIDRGNIVANGTPQELRRKSEWAGAVTLRVSGVAAAAVSAEARPRARGAKGDRARPRRRAGDGARVFPTHAGRRRSGPREWSGRATAGRWRICARRKAGWTRSSAASPCRTRRGRRPTNHELLAHHQDHRQARVAGVFFVAGGVCVHRHFPAADGFFTFMVGGFFERGEASLCAFSSGIPGFTCSWCRRWACGCGRRSGGWARMELLLTMPITPWQAIVGQVPRLVAVSGPGAGCLPFRWSHRQLSGQPGQRGDCHRLRGQLADGGRLPGGELHHLGHHPQPGGELHHLGGGLFVPDPGRLPAGHQPAARPGAATGWLVDVITSFSVITHFEGFQKGVLDSRDILFFLSVIIFSLFTTGVIMRAHRAS